MKRCIALGDRFDKIASQECSDEKSVGLVVNTIVRSGVDCTPSQFKLLWLVVSDEAHMCWNVGSGGRHKYSGKDFPFMLIVGMWNMMVKVFGITPVSLEKNDCGLDEYD